MADAADRFDLQRFVDAQRGVYEQALREMRAGSKQSHWMWFIFPQIAGLGSSGMAQRYALRGRDEAVAYLLHPVLGARLREITAAVEVHAETPGQTLEELFGYPDDLKFHSSMTLFAEAAAAVSAGDEVFARSLQKWFRGQKDQRTLKLLEPPR